MKKYISILASFMAVVCLSACGQKDSNTDKSVEEQTKSDAQSLEVIQNNSKENNDEKLKVVTTIFPEYDWVKQIAGNEISNMDLTLLLDNGVDLHSYQPTAEDIMKVSDCDLFVYVGGESDG